MKVFAILSVLAVSVYCGEIQVCNIYYFFYTSNAVLILKSRFFTQIFRSRSQEIIKYMYNVDRIFIY